MGFRQPCTRFWKSYTRFRQLCTRISYAQPVSCASHVSCACSWPRMDSYACLPLVAVSLISSMVCTEADLVSSKDDIRLTTGFSLTCLGTLLGSQERIRRASCACSWPQMCFMMITNYVCLSLAAHVTHRLGRNVPNQHEIYVQYMHICQNASVQFLRR